MSDIQKAFLWAVGAAVGLAVATLLLRSVGAPTTAGAGGLT